MFWNCQSFAPDKLTDLPTADVICLAETWQRPEHLLTPVPGFTPFASPRLQGAHGGVAALVRSQLAPHCRVWRITHQGDVLWLRLNLLSLDRPLFLAVCYLPPANTPGASLVGTERWSLLADDIAAAAADGYVLLAGDFNAHTGSLDDRTPPVDLHITDLAALIPSTAHLPPRHTRATSINAYGRNLISLCRESSLVILNGRLPGDIPAAPSRSPSSLLDYLITQPAVYSRCRSLRVLP